MSDQPKRRTFSLDFKAAAVIRIDAGESLRDVAGDLNVHFATLSKWANHSKIRARVVELTSPATPEPSRSGVTTPAEASKAAKEAREDSEALALAPDLPPPAPEWLAEQGFSPSTFANFITVVRTYGLPDVAMEVFGLQRSAWLAWVDWATSGSGHREAARACVRVIQARAIWLLDRFERLADGGRGWQGADKALAHADKGRFGGGKDDEKGRLPLDGDVLRQILRIADARSPSAPKEGP